MSYDNQINHYIWSLQAIENYFRCQSNDDGPWFADLVVDYFNNMAYMQASTAIWDWKTSSVYHNDTPTLTQLYEAWRELALLDVLIETGG